MATTSNFPPAPVQEKPWNENIGSYGVSWQRWFTLVQQTFNNSNYVSGQIKGTSSNNNAVAGNIGEYIEARFFSVGITNNTLTSVANMAITPGDWDVTGTILFQCLSGTTATATIAGIYPTNNFIDAVYRVIPLGSTGNLIGAVSAALPTQRYSISAGETMYMNVIAAFSGGALEVTGVIRARRVR